MSKFVVMNGPALDGSGKMKEQEVEAANVEAFKASGWKVGKLPKAEKVEEPLEEPKEEAKPKHKGK